MVLQGRGIPVEGSGSCLDETDELVICENLREIRRVMKRGWDQSTEAHGIDAVPPTMWSMSTRCCRAHND